MIRMTPIVKIADNVLPQELAGALYEEIQRKSWIREVQKKPDHYRAEHHFAGDPRLPAPDEIYSAAFSYAITGDLEEKIIIEHICPLVYRAVGQRYRHVRLNAYRLDSGDHMRAHFDTYIGPVAFVLYLCKDWRADWGGLWISPDFGMVQPAFNRLLVVVGKVPHMVTRVEAHARCPRYSLNGFVKEEE